MTTTLARSRCLYARRKSGRCVEPVSSSPSIKVTTFERRPAVPCLQRGRVHGDPCLVVRRAPAEQPPAPFGRLERRRGPERTVTRRLDVVMGVQQHPARSGRSPGETVHRRMGALHGQRPDVAEPGTPQPPGRRLGRTTQVLRRESRGADGRDTHQAFEFATDAGERGVNRRSDRLRAYFSRQIAPLRRARTAATARNTQCALRPPPKARYGDLSPQAMNCLKRDNGPKH